MGGLHVDRIEVEALVEQVGRACAHFVLLDEAELPARGKVEDVLALVAETVLVDLGVA